MWFSSSTKKCGGITGVENEDFWGQLYAHLIACFGWTWEYIDNNMTLERLKSLEEYWRKYPPQHILLNWYVGYKPPKSEKEKKEEIEANLRGTFNSLIQSNIEVVPLNPLFKEDFVKDFNKKSEQ